MAEVNKKHKGTFYYAVSENSEEVFECTAVYGEAFSACYRNNACWMKTAFAKSSVEIPAETQFLLAKNANCYTLYIMLCDGNARSSLFTKGGRLYCRAETGDTGTTLGEYCYMYSLECANPYDGIKLAYEEIAKELGTITLKSEKKTPEFINTFGYCTYNAFGSDVTRDNLMRVAQSFADNGQRLGFIIADEGWFNSKDGKLSSFKANEDKFEGGISRTINDLKKDYGLKKFICWHTYNGYWKGIDGESFPKHKVRYAPFNIPERFITPADNHAFNATAGSDFYPMNIAYDDSGICCDLGAFYADFYICIGVFM